MERYESSTSERLQYQDGPTGAGLFAMIPSLIGVGIAFAFIRGEGQETQIIRYVLGGFGGLIFLGGLARMLHRSTLTVDRENGLIEACQGSFFMSTRRFRVAEYRGIEVTSRRVSRGRGDYDEFYPLFLLSLGSKVELISPRDCAGARRAAEEIAKLLRYELTDSATLYHQHYAADEVGLSLREREQVQPAKTEPVVTPPAPPTYEQLRERELSVSGALEPTSVLRSSFEAVTPLINREEPKKAASKIDKSQLPEAPPLRRFAYRYDGRTLTVEFPSPRWKAVLKFPMIMFILGLGMLGVLEAIIFTFMAVSGEKKLTFSEHVGPGICVALAAGTIMALVGLLIELPEKWLRKTIEANPEGVRLLTRGLVTSKEQSAKAADIRDVSAAAVATRDGNIMFGLSDVTPAELVWLNESLRLVLIS